MMDLIQTLDYLSALERNNSREWYHANKGQLERARGSFEELVRLLTLKVAEFDSAISPRQAKELTFKLNRDTRFSRDKSPYLPAFRAHIGPEGKLPIPVGYYLMLRPGDRSFLGGGLFADTFPNATAMVRDKLAAEGSRWEKIIAAPEFVKRFHVGGTALKNMPRGYDPDHPQGEFLKNKSWYLEYPLRDDQLLSPGFLDLAAETFRAMAPFNAFLNEALEGFQMPARP